MAALRDWGPTDKGPLTVPEGGKPLEPTKAAEGDPKPLTTTERQELDKLSVVVRKCIGTFVVVGKALKRIRDGKLYRETHATFEEWCRDEYDLSMALAHRQIAASEIFELLSPRGETVVSEFMLRPLARFKPQLIKAIWARALELSGTKGADGQAKVSAVTVAAAASELAPKRTVKSKKPKARRAVTFKAEGCKIVVSFLKQDADIVKALTACLAQQAAPKQRKAA